VNLRVVKRSTGHTHTRTENNTPIEKGLTRARQLADVNVAQVSEPEGCGRERMDFVVEKGVKWVCTLAFTR